MALVVDPLASSVLQIRLGNTLGPRAQEPGVTVVRQHCVFISAKCLHAVKINPLSELNVTNLHL